MKKTIIALAVITASSLANADSKNFAGFNVGLGLDLTSSNLKLTDTYNFSATEGGYTESGTDETSFGSKQKFVPAVSLGYNIPLTNKFLIGLEGKFDLTKGPSSNLSSTDADSEVGVYRSSSATFRQKNHYSLAVKPGYVISDKFMVYGKVAYHKAKSDLSFTSSFLDGVVDSGSLSVKQNGIGFGAGMEYNVTKSMFLRAEIEQIKYKSKVGSSDTTEMDFGLTTNTTSFKPYSTVGGITIGYRF